MGRLEKSYYGLVARWMKKRFHCFQVAVNRGPMYSRIDVVGVRDVGGDLSGDVDVIGIEVKRSGQAFATKCGQTIGYSVYANRVYLADARERPFSPDEMQIASHLGIGLIQISGKRCIEVLSSPFHQPVGRMQLELLDSIQLGRCQWCSSIFELGDRYSKLVRLTGAGRGNKLVRAYDDDMGLMFWNSAVAKRRRKAGLYPARRGLDHDRRYICPDCVDSLTEDLLPPEV